MKRYRIRGPKGGTIVRRATVARIAATLPALVQRFGRVTVTAASSSSATTRARIVAYCRWAIANEPEIHYRQTRPIPFLRRRELPLYTDCSGLATCAYADAGVNDPNGRGYDGSGYTGTLLERGRRIPLTRALAGDLIVYGAGSGHHVVVLLEDGNANGGDPLVCSHGQERGPIAIRHSAELRAQPAGVRVLTYL